MPIGVLVINIVILLLLGLAFGLFFWVVFENILPSKKIYVVHYRHTTFKTKGTMLVNARSVAKAIKIVYKTFDPFFYEITDIVDIGDNKK